MSIVERFSQHLISIKYPKGKTSWNIGGILKNKNAFYKFDVRQMFKLKDGTLAQTGRIHTHADKMVLEFTDKWVVLDVDELNKYVISNKLKKVYLDKVIANLEWNIILLKD
jgi:hypothetical protein|tara:strand:+ start:876 stop:1208 length:333 start_codon:yes stop_codon:yes gene_type:complete